LEKTICFRSKLVLTILSSQHLTKVFFL